MTKLHEMTVEHLGSDATEEDLDQFHAWVREMVESMADLSVDEAVEMLWGEGDYVGNARRLGLAGA